MDELAKRRAKIDEIDQKIMDLINERSATAKKIGDFKKKNKIGVLQENREREVLNHVSDLAVNISPNNARLVWKEIMSASRQIQGEQVKVGYLGPKGTFTEQAAFLYFPKGNSEFVPYNQKYEVFSEVEKGHITFGIVPVENSIQGSVNETLDLLIESNVNIYGEIEQRIIHNLIGMEGTDLTKIQKVYSHPVALAQIRTWIKKNIPNAQLIDTTSTAFAIKKVKEMNDSTCVAIGNKHAAEIYGLSILADSIEDETSNYTRFLIISKEKHPKTDNDKTSMVFVTKHKPGALFNILQYFAEAKVNLAKIESRPRKRSKSSIWEYIFILDFDEHIDNVENVLSKVQDNAIWMKILGSYPRKSKITK